MPHRTSLILDDESAKAAREVARHLGCSNSEAIRRAVIRYRDHLIGVSAAERGRRKKLLRQLFALFEGNDAAAEVARLKAEDQGF